MIAQVTAQILSQAKGNVCDFLVDKGGLYHLSASGYTSWYGFAKAIFEHDHSERILQRLVAITSEQYPTPAKRPSYSWLNGDKLYNTFELFVPEWERCLELALNSNK